MQCFIEDFTSADNFDFIYSQFAIEYSDIETSLNQLSSISNPGCILAFICHEEGSVFYTAAHNELDEINWLLNEINLFDSVNKQVELKHQRLNISDLSVISKYKEQNREYKSLIKKLFKYFKVPKKS